MTAVAIVGAGADGLTLEVQHDKWPPPRCTAVFDDVAYVQLPMRSRSFARVAARASSEVLAARPSWLGVL